MRLSLTLSAEILLLIFQVCFAGFDPCKFNFGMAWNGTGANYSEVDYVTIPAGSDEDFNQNWIGQMLSQCKVQGKTPVLYGSIIANTARRDLGLKDCNGAASDLCLQGANFIRQKKSRITGQYTKYIDGVKNAFGTSSPVIWLIEPGFRRYCEADQDGGGIPQKDAGDLMHELVGMIKNSLPNAWISMDISPEVSDQSAWLNNFKMDDFTFLNTSGGRTNASSGLIRNGNPTSWKGIHDLTHKCIIADDGYALDGSSSGHDATWDDVYNIKNRMTDGVLAITQANPKSDWETTIAALRPQLSKPICPCENLIKSRFSLSITAKGTGTVTVDPTGTSFDSATTVKLIAKPSEGEKFIGWEGALSGTQTVDSIFINANKSVTANFSSNRHTLTILTSGFGAVSVSPQASSYDSGTMITITAKPGDGATFTGWSGALSGAANPATLKLSENETITASFAGGQIPGNLVKNSDFATNADNWNFGVYDAAKATGGQSGGKYSVTTQSVGAAEWNIQFTQGGIKLLQGVAYRLSFKASAKAATTLQVNIGMGGSPYTSFSQLQTINLVDHDSVYVITFTMNEAATTDARLEFNAGKTSGTWSLDDVVLMNQATIGVKNPKRFSVPKVNASWPPLGPNDRVTITLFDHAGRLIREATGRLADATREVQTRKTGVYLMVVRVAGKSLVEKLIVSGR
jgi:hypothetical protein